MGGRRDQGALAQGQASSLLPDISDACVSLAPGCLGWVIGTCSAEGKAWQRLVPLCVVSMCALSEAAARPLTQRGVSAAACHAREWGICLHKRFPCCQHLTRCSQTCVIVGSGMLITCIFNVQTVLRKKPRRNLLGADSNGFSLRQRSPRE